LEHWSMENVNMCARRQQAILEEAAIMLRPGGTLIYSTCTFAPEENEGSMGRFLEKHPEFSVKKVTAYEGFAPGHPEWSDAHPEIRDTFRLWPHKLEGEGHYVAVLQKYGERNPREGLWKLPSADPAVLKLYEVFVQQNLQGTLDGIPILFGEQLYLLPHAIPLKGLKVLRLGLHLGTIKKNRFEPAHALALALRAEEAQRCCNLSIEQAEAYLRGETLNINGEKGWILVLVNGYSLGWGKQSSGILKNHYPKGLRKR